MKLFECIQSTKTTIWADIVEDVHIEFMVEEVELQEGTIKGTFVANTPGGKVSGYKGALATIANNPMLTGMIAGYAIDALQKYTSNKKKYTTHFYAKSFEDRRLYRQVVADLMKTGHYKKVREKMVDGGILWVLQRNKI